MGIRYRADEPPYVDGQPAPGPWRASDAQGEWGVYDFYGNRCLAAAGEEGDEAAAKLAADAGTTYHETNGALPSQLVALLREAEAFIAGFEDDEAQEGGPELLAQIRAALPASEGAS